MFNLFVIASDWQRMFHKHAVSYLMFKSLVNCFRSRLLNDVCLVFAFEKGQSVVKDDSAICAKSLNFVSFCFSEGRKNSRKCLFCSDYSNRFLRYYGVCVSRCDRFSPRNTSNTANDDEVLKIRREREVNLILVQLTT